MSAISCVVVDDEPLARKLIESYIARIPHLQCRGYFGEAAAAGMFLRTHPVDLLLLDIQMPELNGLQFVHSLDKPPAVIFITAHRNFGPEAFDVKALDYLVKPVSFERFLKAINRFQSGPAQKKEHEDGYLSFPSNRSVCRVRYADIQLIESLDDEVLVHTTGRTLSTRKPISKIQEELPTSQFVRVHRSFIVSVAHAGSISAVGVEVNGRLIPFGRSYKREAMQSLGVR